MPQSVISRAMVTTALAAGLLVPGQAMAAAAGTTPAPSPGAAAAAVAPVRITEGQVKEARPGGSILYPSVTSCLTVTARLSGGGLVGAHISLFQVPGAYRSDQILPVLRTVVGKRRVREVEVKGAVGAWYPGYLTKAVESYGPDEQVPTPAKPDPDGIADAVARGLLLPRSAVTVQDVPDGDLTVR
ncbi:hypothetical protein ACIHFE_20125 [Streptomyces sp. NPDC052396]|uniref:hypothetical protein n=1 Tax=Streptomyces sp. NPDC052396 TaxID=3365689 RepID=UPI0037CE2B80